MRSTYISKDQGNFKALPTFLIRPLFEFQLSNWHDTIIARYILQRNILNIRCQYFQTYLIMFDLAFWITSLDFKSRSRKY